MRFETHTASSFFVSNLIHTGVVTSVLEDGGDIVCVELNGSERVLFHLIEQPIEAYEIRDTIKRNSQSGIYTLYIFWADLLLPSPGTVYDLDDWMEVVLQAHGDKIYGYEVYGREAFFFPVYFTGTGKRRYIKYGPTIQFRHFHFLYVKTPLGPWRIAEFSDQPQEKIHSGDPAQRKNLRGIAADYDLLGVMEDADVDAVKQAYRTLARLYHPDLNKSSVAPERMTTINIAYARIIAHLTDQN